MLRERREALRNKIQFVTKDRLEPSSGKTAPSSIRESIRSRREITTGRNQSQPSQPSEATGIITQQQQQQQQQQWYSLGDHLEYLHMHQDAGGHYYADVSHLLYDDSSIPGLVKDFSSPIEERDLLTLYYGLDELTHRMSTTGSSSSTTTTTKNYNSIGEPLPVRTMTMRIAPDVMTAVVLDAVQDACQQQPQEVVTAQVLKRLHGHFQCLFVPCPGSSPSPSPSPKQQAIEGGDNNDHDDENKDCAFLLDARVCTQTKGNLDRILLLRIFYADYQTQDYPPEAHPIPSRGLKATLAAATTPFFSNSTSTSTSTTTTPTKKQTPRKSAKEIRDQAIANIGSMSRQPTSLMIPINLHLRSAASFVQYLQKQQQIVQNQQNPHPSLWNSKTNAILVATIPSPAESPKASTAYFMGNLEPTFSVQLHPQLPHVHSHHLFPSLNSDDWALLQSSWPLLSSIWRNLTEHYCLFHTSAAAPIPQMALSSAPQKATETTDEEEHEGTNQDTIENNNVAADAAADAAAAAAISTNLPLIVLDHHYCSQIRQIARDNMLTEVLHNFQEIQSNLERVEANHANFLKILQRALTKYRLLLPKLGGNDNTTKNEKHAAATNNSITTKPPPKLKAPSTVPPAGYIDLAAMVCKTVKQPPHPLPQRPLTDLCDEAVVKVYKTFSSQDNHDSRKHLKESNAAVMQRLVEIQATQQQLILSLERSHPAHTEVAARQFTQGAQEATNHKGRVDRILRARVPLVSFDLLGDGQCQISATNMLCRRSDQRMQVLSSFLSGGQSSDKYTLFDLKAISFQMISANCLVIRSIRTRETLYKLHTSTDLQSLIKFLQTLQTLQSVLTETMTITTTTKATTGSTTASTAKSGNGSNTPSGGNDQS